MTNVVATPPETEDALEAGAIHPAGRSGVPAPPAASGVRRPGVDVAGHHVRLRLVASDVRRRAAVVDRVQHVEELRRLVAAAQPGQRHHDPDGRVRVLAAVLPDAGRVALDVARLLRRPIERRIEQQQQSAIRARSATCAPHPSRARQSGSGRRPRGPPTTARSSRCCTRRSAPIPAACRRRSSRAGTTRRPTTVRAWSRAAALRSCSGRPGRRPSARGRAARSR